MRPPTRTPRTYPPIQGERERERRDGTGGRETMRKGGEGEKEEGERERERERERVRVISWPYLQCPGLFVAPCRPRTRRA